MIHDLVTIHADLSRKLEQRRREAEPRARTETFRVPKIVREPDSTLELRTVELEAVVSAESRRPTKFRRNELNPLETLHSFYDGGWAWKHLPDEEIAQAALAFLRECNTSRPGHWLSLLGPLNVTLALGLLARAGAVETKPWQVPTHSPEDSRPLTK